MPQSRYTPLDSQDRSGFDCGEASLNDYLQRFARQNSKRGSSKTYVAAPENSVLGYFTLCAGSVALENFPLLGRKGLPRLVPVVHLARLAVDQGTQGQGLGEALLLGALETSLSVADIIGVMGIEVWAINDSARAFYGRYNFQTLEDDFYHLYLSTEAASGFWIPSKCHLI